MVSRFSSYFTETSLIGMLSRRLNQFVLHVEEPLSRRPVVEFASGACLTNMPVQMEDSGNDPREFHNVGQADFGDIGLGPLGLLGACAAYRVTRRFLTDRHTPCMPCCHIASINEILRSSSPSRRDATTPQTTSPSRDQPQSPFGSGNGLRFEFGTPASRRTLVFGGPQTMNRMQSDPDTRIPGGPPQMPRLSECVRDIIHDQYCADIFSGIVF